MKTDTVRELEESFVRVIAEQIAARPEQVRAAAELFAGGATVAFVARYRKEATGGLVDEQLETLAKRRDYFLDLAQRRDAILESIAEQGKLSSELEGAVRAAMTKSELEDLYRPYRPKRRTRAGVAREKGLEPLAEELVARAASDDSAQDLAARFIDPEKGVEDAETALAGARDILAERLADSAEHRAHLREHLRGAARLVVRAVTGKEAEGKVYADYFDHSEPAARVASHRLLAILRGEKEGVLSADLEIDDEGEIARLARSWGVDLATPCGEQLATASRDAYRRLLRPSITSEVRVELRERAERESIAVFRANLEALLLQSPLGRCVVLGVDPGYRTGCKLAVVDATGKVLDTGVAHIAPPRPDAETVAASIVELVRSHGLNAVAIGNGTGGREAESFIKSSLRDSGLEEVIVAIVPETGASVYSASAVAREELPDLDVSLRGAVSIARRLQDPLAELVKIDPRSLGIGQYQHDVDPRALGGELELTVERAVNRVGVELNTASPALLRRVSGLSERLARNLVSHRDTNGPFRSREQLLEVSGLGPKTFELAAGFLRIRDGVHPLDATAVHPERYEVVEAMARERGVDLGGLVGNREQIAALDLTRFADEKAGLGAYTLEDIREELERPGRDPRPQFEAPKLRDDVRTLEDVEEGMVLEGRVSNVTRFGAFVDIGVKRDGLVHLSELSHRWIEQPQEVVHVGQIVEVRVMEVDRDRERIGLSMKALQAPPASGARSSGRAERRDGNSRNAERSKRRGGGREGKRRAGGSQASGGASKRKSDSSDSGGTTTLEDLLSKFAPRHRRATRPRGCRPLRW